MILECPIRSLVIAILSFLLVLLFGIFFFFFFFGRNGVLCRVFCFYLIVQILFHSSLSALVVEAGRSWCGIGMLDSFVPSVVASLAKESAFSFLSIPWCGGIQVIIICLWSLVSSMYVF